MYLNPDKLLIYNAASLFGVSLWGHLFYDILLIGPPQSPAAIQLAKSAALYHLAANKTML